MKNSDSLMDVLIKEDCVVDKILLAQENVREAVKNRNWLELEKNISRMEDFATDFIMLDSLRESFDKSSFSVESHLLSKQIQSKLLKSKIINSALNDYINISRGFVQNVIENVVPQRKSVVYSKNGNLVKSLPQSVVLNKIF